jgi:hypothetical protein
MRSYIRRIILHPIFYRILILIGILSILLIISAISIYSTSYVTIDPFFLLGVAAFGMLTLLRWAFDQLGGETVHSQDSRTIRDLEAVMIERLKPLLTASKLPTWTSGMSSNL